MAAICRFGMRVVPNISEIIAQCRNKKQLVQGPHIAEFQQEFLRRISETNTVGEYRIGPSDGGDVA
jgi:hypothetical protein